MTMPNGRTRAILETHLFLRELLSHNETPGVPEAIREQARRLPRHYPLGSDVHMAHMEVPRLFVPIDNRDTC
jgi:hypothetical protein